MVSAIRVTHANTDNRDCNGMQGTVYDSVVETQQKMALPCGSTVSRAFVGNIVFACHVRSVYAKTEGVCGTMLHARVSNYGFTHVARWSSMSN
jgi:hypothetical protein